MAQCIEPTLSAVHISKSFPGVKALTDVSIDFYPGEVHALLGENGAGKSTLIKILSGIYQPSSGQVIYNGKTHVFLSPHDAIVNGIAVIHQELSIASDLTVAENVFLGVEPQHGLLLDRAMMNQQTQKILDSMKVDIKATEKAGKLTVAHQQMVEIAKVINKEAKVVIMDEPTSSLSEDETEALFDQIRLLRTKGVTVIYISHRMREIFELCDRATILRDGCKVKTVLIRDTNERDIVSSMVGRTLGDYYNRQPHHQGEEILRIEQLTRHGEFSNISFKAYAGEILGISGLVGAGRTELMETIFGARSADSGEIYLKGKQVQLSQPIDAIRINMGLVTEDRRRTGLMLQKSIEDNMVLPSLIKRGSLKSLLDFKWMSEMSKKMIDTLRIKTPSAQTVIANLSGGNQQKVILAKWLLADAEILILDEPTRGIDVNAKSEFYALMNEFVDRGGCIIMVSSELPEILGISDRILVMREGELVGEVCIDDATEEKIMHMASLGEKVERDSY